MSPEQRDQVIDALEALEAALMARHGPYYGIAILREQGRNASAVIGNTMQALTEGSKEDRARCSSCGAICPQHHGCPASVEGSKP